VRDRFGEGVGWRGLVDTPLRTPHVLALEREHKRVRPQAWALHSRPRPHTPRLHCHQ